MRKGMVLACFGLLLLLAACSKPSPTPAATATATPGQLPTVTSSSTPVSTPAPSTTAMPVVVTPTAFFLDVTAPLDESVLQGTSVQVVGKTVPDAIVSVNGQPVDVGADGGFFTTVALQEGPNSIEIIASGFSGNHASKILTVVAIR